MHPLQHGELMILTLLGLRWGVFVKYLPTVLHEDLYGTFMRVFIFSGKGRRPLNRCSEDIDEDYVAGPGGAVDLFVQPGVLGRSERRSSALLLSW